MITGYGSNCVGLILSKKITENIIIIPNYNTINLLLSPQWAYLFQTHLTEGMLNRDGELI